MSPLPGSILHLRRFAHSTFLELSWCFSPCTVLSSRSDELSSPPCLSRRLRRRPPLSRFLSWCNRSANHFGIRWPTLQGFSLSGVSRSKRSPSSRRAPRGRTFLFCSPASGRLSSFSSLNCQGQVLHLSAVSCRRSRSLRFSCFVALQRIPIST